MEVYKHKDINMTASEIISAVETGIIPKGVAINVMENQITAEPDGTVCLFPELDDRYERIFYNED